MEVNVKEARAKLSTLLNKAEKGEDVVILRRGKQIVRLVAVDKINKHLPDLSKFRNSIKLKGQPLSSIIKQDREEGRY